MTDPRPDTATLLQTALDALSDGVVVLSAGRMLAHNRRFAEMWALPAEVLAAGDAAAALVHVATQMRDPDAFRARVAAPPPDPAAHTFDTVECADGRIIERHAGPFVVAGRTVGRLFRFRDVSDQRHAETALRASEQRFRALIDNTSEGIVLLDREATVHFANPAATRTVGYRLEDVRNRGFLDHVHPDDAARVRALFSEVLKHPLGRGGDRFRTRHRDGSWRTVEGTFANLLEETGVRHVVLHLRDITEAQLLQRRLEQAERMEAIGRLAGGVAHDFNNLLTAIVGHAELLRDAIADPAVLEDLEEIEKAAERATALTQQLLAFSRRQVLQPVVLDLNQVVEGMRRMLQRLIGEDVRLVVRAGDGLGRVKADRAQVEQVLLNLVVNARDAMPRGGTVVVETANRDLDEWFARSHGSVAPGRYVLLTVTDTGHGIDPRAREHIFEPFFTTRARGTGLGLATVYGVVSQSGGHITVDSETEMGTTFAVFLPRVEPEAPAPAPERPHASRLTGTETVLVVEDEEVVRELAARVLRQYGYTVLTAADGEEALRVAAHHPGPLHLVLSDVVMPGMSGPQAVERLRAARPDLRVLFMSGYTDEAMASHGLADGAMPFLAKPFTPWGLAARVRDVLDAGAA